jgi:hypothetical protein
MATSKPQSEYDFFNGKFRFTNESIPVRIMIILLFFLFILSVIIFLSKLAIPVFLAKALLSGFSGVLKFFKGRSP